MDKKKHIRNILYQLFVVALTGLSNFIVTIIYSIIYSDSSVLILILYILFGVVFYTVPPMAFGWLLLKNSGKLSQDAVSYFVPTFVLWILASVAFFEARGNDGIGFSIAFMNFPGFLLSGIIPEIFPDDTSVRSDILSSVVTGFSVVISCTLAYLGLFIKRRTEAKRKPVKTQNG